MHCCSFLFHFQVYHQFSFTSRYFSGWFFREKSERSLLVHQNVLRVECTARAFHTNICFTPRTCVLAYGENSEDTGLIYTSKPFVNHCMLSKDTVQDLIKIVLDAFLWKLYIALYHVYGCCSGQTSVSAVYFTPPVIPWGGFQDAFILRYNYNKY